MIDATAWTRTGRRLVIAVTAAMAALVPVAGVPKPMGPAMLIALARQLPFAMQAQARSGAGVDARRRRAHISGMARAHVLVPPRVALASVP